ncbi:cellulose biosynthesis protein BcsN [Methylobacterium sp. EM32]|uniref:cellulose biosynthesis protein BcsN n=1 Tax=Methylobacterium sp. EM32 TaxID=3163481 RepID=UPI0033B19715
MIRPFALAAALALGACTAQERAAAPHFASLDAALPPATAPRRSTPVVATPMVVLPAWIGRPVALRERDGAGGFEQAITLRPPGARKGRDDLILVSSPKDGALDALLGGKPTEAGIRAELAAALPDLAMQVVTRPSANAYGPTGLAIGRTGATRCLYAWQWIPEVPMLAGGAPAPLSLRLRLCRDDVTVEAMAAAVTQLRLVPRFSGEPVSTPARIVSRSEPPPAGRVRHPRSAPIAAAPAPGPASSGPRYLGEADERPPAAVGASRGAVRSNLADALDAPSPALATLPPDAASLPPDAAILPPDAAILPPEATRGPVRRP